IQQENLSAAREPAGEDPLLLVAAAGGIDRSLNTRHLDREPRRDFLALSAFLAASNEPGDGIGDKAVEVRKRDVLAHAGAGQQALRVSVFRHERNARVLRVARRA